MKLDKDCIGKQKCGIILTSVDIENNAKRDGFTHGHLTKVTANFFDIYENRNFARHIMFDEQDDIGKCALIAYFSPIPTEYLESVSAYFNEYINKTNLADLSRVKLYALDYILNNYDAILIGTIDGW